MINMNNNFDQTASEQIETLAVGSLSSVELEKIDQLTRDLLSTEVNREPAVNTLQSIFGHTPKRPVYYLYLDIRALPEKTRYVVENTGNFIDVLVKCCAHELGKKQLFALRSSLSSNIKRLKNVMPEKFLKNLGLFDALFYVPAKHKWDVGDRPHLFSVKETVTCLFIARHIADDIIKSSEEARRWSIKD